MKDQRTWGKPPNRIAVVHGGPGAPGSVAPIARELSRACGVLEPFQTAKTLDGQVEELRILLEKHADLPCIVIGWSHGASLSCILAARYPDIIRKLIIIGTTPFEERYQADIARKRLSRLSEQERTEFLFAGNEDAGLC
jgi:pimeloyl-ACP methyl ester carboxylesterase